MTCRLMVVGVSGWTTPQARVVTHTVTNRRAPGENQVVSAEQTSFPNPKEKSIRRKNSEEKKPKAHQLISKAGVQ